MLRMRKEKSIFEEKVYCGQCKFEERDRCKENPNTLSEEYFAPGKTTLHKELCGVKNEKNDCPDFKRK